jgi:DNA-3-methyladenine glycosylase I
LRSSAPPFYKDAVKTRCAWANPKNPLYVEYHDREWGVPVHDDRHLLEMLILEGAQAGLSWETILNKRENYRRRFENFEPERLVRWGERQIRAALNDAGIVRNELKVRSAVTNAREMLRVREEEGSFDRYLWSFVGGRPIRHQFANLRQIPATTPESDAMSKALRKRGFKFVGSTICYAFMQAVGMVDDHTTDCFRSSAGR